MEEPEKFGTTAREPASPGAGRERESSAALELAKHFQERLRRLAEPVQRGARFVREEVIAQGGMGVIRRVRDLELNRELAVKETKGGVGSQPPVEAARFFEEAQVTAQLDHPGVVPIHEVGLDAEGRLYFAMKLVQGRDLKAILDLAGDEREGWTRTRVLGVVLKVCEAMAYAHSKGVIHRDLKPANVMVGHYGEVYVMDWGLARAMGRPDMHDIRVQPAQSSDSVRTERREAREETPDSPLVTMDGVVVGTPAYMPPEQARGEVLLLSRRSDVYSIGALLYHLLAGHPPYLPRGVNVSSRHVLWRVIEGPPRPVNELDRDLPAELVAICAKAMARDPELRYPDMLALGEDLRAYLEGRVVRAHETGAVAELKKWVGRNKGLAAAIAAAIVALAAGFATSSTFYVQAADSAAQAEEERDRADLEAAEVRTKAEQVLRLSAPTILAELELEAAKLGPPWPENAAAFEDWLRRANGLIAELPRFELELSRMPRSLDEAERRTLRAGHPEFPVLSAALRERDYLCALQAALEAGRALDELAAPETAAVLASLPTSPGEIEELAWQLVEPDRLEFGGEASGLVLAQKALDLAGDRPGSERARLRMTFAWALFANGRLDEASAEARRVRAETGEERKEELAREVALLDAAIERLASADGMQAGRVRLVQLDAEIAMLERRIAGRSERIFDPSEEGWWNSKLEKLVAELKAFSDPATGLCSAGISPEHGWGIRKRLELAQTIQERGLSGPKAAALWSEATASIHDRSRCPMYRGLSLAPQVGLLPLGRDPVSDLWEFADLSTGEPAVRGTDGRLVLAEETGLVLVLLPGGSFWMGAQPGDAAGRNHDPWALPGETPVGEVRLAPFLVSKYEMTQGQWLRLSGENPSAGAPARGEPRTLLHPVESVTWQECEKRLAWIGMSLPTEAQWEYAARAGTTTPWWTGSTPGSLAGAANLSVRDGDRRTSNEAWPGDGHARHAPVGSFRPNAFGLHDTIGNVWEWCQDNDLGYELRPRSRDGRREIALAPNTRILRGGGRESDAVAGRSAARFAMAEESRSDSFGLRPARPVVTRPAPSAR